jgi:hypothetical protein
LAFESRKLRHGIIIKTLKELVLIHEGIEVLACLRGFHKLRRLLSLVSSMIMVLSLDFLKEMLLSFLEELMIVDMVNVLSSSFVEVVHVELSNKGSKVVVFEIGWENFLTELRRLFDDKSSTFGIPVNDFREFSFFKNVVCFSDKRRNRVLRMGLGLGFVLLSLRSHWKLKEV